MRARSPSPHPWDSLTTMGPLARVRYVPTSVDFAHNNLMPPARDGCSVGTRSGRSRDFDTSLFEERDRPETRRKFLFVSSVAWVSLTTVVYPLRVLAGSRKLFEERYRGGRRQGRACERGPLTVSRSPALETSHQRCFGRYAEVLQRSTSRSPALNPYRQRRFGGGVSRFGLIRAHTPIMQKF